MVQEETSQAHVIERHFGYSNVLWEVENYFSATCTRDWIIYSPDFSVVSNQVTKWRMFLKGKQIKDHNIVHIYLERLENDTGPREVQAKWRLSYPYGQQEQTAPEFSTIFEKNQAVKTEVGNADSLETSLRRFSFQTFKVRCRIIVYNKDTTTYISDDLGLKCLSQDMAVLYRVPKESDVTLFVGQNIFAHKNILSIRNKILKREIEKLGETIDMDFTWLKAKAAEALIAFLYTGNLEYVLRTPSLAMHDIIHFLSVTELKSYYTADDLTIRSSFGLKEFCFIWTTSNHSSREENCILSPCWRIGINNSAFQLILYLKKFDSEGEYLSIYGQFVMDEGPKQLFFECAVLDVNGSLQELKCLRWTSDENKRIGFEKFITKECAEHIIDCTTDNELKILCRLQIPTDSQKNSVVHSKTHSLVGTEKNYHFRKLSEDLGNLFESGKYADFTIESRVLRYKVHTAILKCRSHVFGRMITDAQKSASMFVTILDIDTYTLRIVLKYMYTGILTPTKLEYVKRIYQAAEKFCILPLKQTCTQILQDSINVQNVFEIVLLSNKYKNLKLKFAAFRFICVNVTEIQQSKEWTDFVALDNPINKELASYIKKFIAIHNREKIIQSGYTNIEDFIRHYKSSNTPG